MKDKKYQISFVDFGCFDKYENDTKNAIDK